MTNEALIKNMQEFGGYVEKKYVYNLEYMESWYGYVKGGRGMATPVPDFEDLDEGLFVHPSTFYNGAPEECWYLKK